MTKPTTEATGVRAFFSASQLREERWRTLNRVAKALAGGGSKGGGHTQRRPQALLGPSWGPLEELCGYPGPRLMAQVHERLQTGDGTGLARLVQRISNALL